MAGGGKVQIKGGIASKNEAEVIDGALLVTAVGGAGGAQVIEHSFFGVAGGSTPIAILDLDIMLADPDGPALPILRNLTATDVGVSFLHNTAPNGGTWTLRMQKRLAGTDVFVEVATFVFDT